MVARFALAAVVFGACYAPQAPQGAPCDDQHPCPTGQACIAGVCDGTPGGTTDGSITKQPDAAPTPGDVDADGVANANDNCPSVSNPDQGNEDGDPLGDDCDPCPIDPVNPPSDPDGDGVSDSCDPRPMIGGDAILVFEGFHAGVPSNWQVIGTTMPVGDDIVMVGVAGDRGALVPPIVAPTSGTISMKATITATHGNTSDAALAVVMPYDPGPDQGIFCELYAPDAGSTTGRTLDLWDSVAAVERATQALAWQVNTAYTMIEKRTSSAYTCSANGTTISGSSNNAPSNQAAVFTYSVTASISWLLVVASQ